MGLFTKESVDFSLQFIILGVYFEESDDFSLQFHDDLGYVQSSHPPICLPVKKKQHHTVLPPVQRHQASFFVAFEHQILASKLTTGELEKWTIFQ